MIKLLILQSVFVLCSGLVLSRRSDEPQTAFVNMLRHGEDCHVGPKDISTYGKMRARYLARCLSVDTPSLINPYGGPPVAIFAARMDGKNPSGRPTVTASPLANASGLEVLTPCSRKEDFKSLENFSACQAPFALQALQPGRTVDVFMTKHEMPYFVLALNNGTVPGYKFAGMKGTEFARWPDSRCSSPDNPWIGDKCSGGVACTDMVWQMEFTRASPGDDWKAVAVRKLWQDFMGSETQKCEGDLTPLPLGSNLNEKRKSRKQHLANTEPVRKHSRYDKALADRKSGLAPAPNDGGIE